MLPGTLLAVGSNQVGIIGSARLKIVNTSTSAYPSVLSFVNGTLVCIGSTCTFTPSGGGDGDNLGTHIATKDVDANSFQIVNVDKLGIGTSVPLFNLHLKPTIPAANGNIYLGMVDGTNAKNFAGQSSLLLAAPASASHGFNLVFGDSGLNDDASIQSLYDSGPSPAVKQLRLKMSDNPVFTIDNTGKAGVNTVDPRSVLEVTTGTNNGTVLFIVSTGTSKLFEVTGTSVSSLVNLFIPLRNAPVLGTDANGRIIVGSGGSGGSSGLAFYVPNDQFVNTPSTVVIDNSNFLEYLSDTGTGTIRIPYTASGTVTGLRVRGVFTTTSPISAPDIYKLNFFLSTGQLKIDAAGGYTLAQGTINARLDALSVSTTAMAVMIGTTGVSLLNLYSAVSVTTNTLAVQIGTTGVALINLTAAVSQTTNTLMLAISTTGTALEAFRAEVLSGTTTLATAISTTGAKVTDNFNLLNSQFGAIGSTNITNNSIGGLDIAQNAVVSTHTDFSKGLITVGSISVVGTYTSTSAINGAQAKFSSMSVIGTITSTSGFVGPVSSITALSLVDATQISATGKGAGKILSMNADNSLAFVADQTSAGGGDNLGNHVATMPIVSEFAATFSSMTAQNVFVASAVVAAITSTGTTNLAGDTIMYSTDAAVGWINDVSFSSSIISTPGVMGYGMPVYEQNDSTGDAAMWYFAIDSRAVSKDATVWLEFESTGTHPDPITAGIAIGTPSVNGNRLNNVIWFSTGLVQGSSVTPGAAGPMKQVFYVIQNSAQLFGTQNHVILLKLWNLPVNGSGQRVHRPPVLYYVKRS